uniref:Uncharacterized protein n=1 Tax=Romanomermis culicivorax TaxID=13658 RepID=A0A915I460_ROMCU
MDVKCEKARPLTGEQCAVLIEQVENSKGVLFSKDGKSGMRCWENILSKSRKKIGKKKKGASWDPNTDPNHGGDPINTDPDPDWPMPILKESDRDWDFLAHVHE